MQAFIQIAIHGDSVEHVFEALKKMGEVQEVFTLFGEWDFLARVRVSSPEELGTFVIDKIRPLPGVRLTSTMIIAK